MFHIITISFCLCFYVLFPRTKAVYPLGAPDTRCKIDFGMVADESNAQRYLICRYGKVVKHYSCFDGMLYDPNSRLCNSSDKVDTGKRLTGNNASVTTGCYMGLLGVTLHVENRIRLPKFSLSIDLRVPRLPLFYILMFAAGKVADFRYNTEVLKGYGEFVTMVNGIAADHVNKTMWLIWSGGFPIEPPDIRSIFPSDGDHILLRYQAYIGER